MKKLNFLLIIILCYACSPQAYTVYEMKSSPVQMDNTFDKSANVQVANLVNYYSEMINSASSTAIGEASRTLTIEKPARELVYFTLNAMKQFGENEGVDLALMNINGHRSNLNKGIITLGDMYEIYSFDNTLVYVELMGKDILETLKSDKVLCSNISQNETVFINNFPLDRDKTYKIITLDYLAGGGDELAVMKNAVNFHDTGVLLRDFMISYIKKIAILPPTP